MYEKPAIRSRQRSTVLVVLMLVLLVAGTLAACGEEVNYIGPEPYSATQTRNTTLTLPDGALAQLQVHNSVGQITLVAGDQPDQIAIAYTKTTYGETQDEADEELDDMTLTIDQDDALVQIDGRQSSPSGQRSNQIDLTITVPAEIGLVVTCSVGDIRVDDVTINGQLQASCSTGSIVFQDVAAPAGALLSTDVGDVRFSGALGADATVEVDVGSIRMTLRDTSADLVAAVNVGSLNIDGFPDSDVTLEQEGVGGTAGGTLGTGGPELRLTVNVGDITLTSG